jgi:transcriptional regulator with XRE-family HTH domain
MATKSPRAVDRHVGTRIRMRRRAIGVSQQKLAKALGIAIAQVQKYESGTNRVSASRLQEIAVALQVTPASFFDGAPTNTKGHKPLTRIRSFLASPEGAALAQAFTKIGDNKMRRIIVTLVKRAGKL